MGTNDSAAVFFEYFKKEHLMQLLDEPHNNELKRTINEETILEAEASKNCFTMFAKDTNQILFCGGIIKYNENVAECWCVFHSNVKKYFRQMHMLSKRYFEIMNLKISRIEATVKKDFPQGHRWIKLLGFNYEKTYTLDENFDLYAKESF